MHLHRLAEARSLAYHRAVAERIRADPSLLAVPRERIRAWLAQGGRSVPYFRLWAALLELPLAELLAGMVDEGEQAIALRQATPFAGLLDARERWRIWRDTRERLEGAP